MFANQIQMPSPVPSMYHQATVVHKQTNEVLCNANDFWAKFVEPSLCSQMNRRKKFQKVEFCAAWAFIIFVALVKAGVVATSSGMIFSFGMGTSNMTKEQGLDTGFEQLLSFYLRITLLTRSVAYAIDFANAIEKIGKLPSWLVLHHCGVFLGHLLVAYEFDHSDTTKAILYLLSIQSSHNTWTKKHGLKLYWGNVFIGSVAASIFFPQNVMQGSLSNGAYVLCLVAPLLAYTGIGLLKAECSRNQKRSTEDIVKQEKEYKCPK